MADIADERLNRLQEADLGTARREYISTVDRGFRETRIQVIEAFRRSNIPGSEEQRLAKANKSRLDAWANVHREIGDTDDLEELDNLLNGQSHRLRLDSIMRGNGAVAATQRIPAISSGPAARHVSQSVRRPSSGDAQISAQSRSGLNPALERNNAGNTIKKSKPVGKSGGSKGLTPETHTVRKLTATLISGNFSQLISSPEEFLAAARGQISTRQSPKEALPAKPHIPDIPQTDSPEKSSLPAKASSHHSQQPSNIGRPSGNHVATNHTTLPTSVGEAMSTAHKSNSYSTQRGMSPTASIHAKEQVKSQRGSDAAPQKLAVDTKDTIQTAPPQKADGILLDLSCATPSKSGPEPGMSPALEELKGLDFMQDSEPQSPSPSGFVDANRRLDFEGALSTEQKLNEVEATEATVASEDVAEYKREIETICNLLQRGSLSEIFLTKMTECKQELESRVRTMEKGQGKRLADLSSAGIKELDSIIKSAVTPVVEGSPKQETVRHHLPRTLPEPERQENKFAASNAGVTPNHSRNVSLSTPTSQSRLNGAAPQFMPGSFTAHRSISNATSTDSSTSFHSVLTMAMPETPVPMTIDKSSPQSTSESIKAEFAAKVRRTVGETKDLLPSGKAGTPEGLKKPVSHIFGDHLLPGRRVTQPSLTRPGIPPYPESVLAKAAAPKFSNITFTLAPRSKPIKIVSPNIFAQGKIKAEAAPSSKAATSHFDPNEPLTLKPGNITAPAAKANAVRKTAGKTTSMMESIYAPKPDVVSSSTENKKPSVNQGLMGSRYADAQWP